MPIPETPYTREEAYLNAIATGDSSGIPETPYTREEMYLDYIARNGGGGGGGGGSSTLAGLTDVDISNPTDGQTLVYNSTSGKWENGAGGGGSSGFTLLQATYDDETYQFVLPVTATELFTLMGSSMVAFRVINEWGDSSGEILFYLISAQKTTYDGDPTRYRFVTGDGLDSNDLGENDIVKFSEGF